MLLSPYQGHPKDAWAGITRQLVDIFPLPMDVLVETVEAAWDDIYTSSFGDTGLRIGQEIFLPAQATGVILERLVAVHLHKRFPNWRGGQRKFEKDIVCTDDLKSLLRSKRPRAKPDSMETAVRATGSKDDPNSGQAITS